jgi:hypothetical protein
MAYAPSVTASAARLGPPFFLSFSDLHAFPAWTTFDGIDASFDLPGVVLVRGNQNRRASVSGAVPLLVPR